MYRKLLIGILSLFVLFGASVAWSAPVVQEIYYEKYYDTKNLNVDPVTVTFRFSLYDAETGGTAVWQEEKDLIPTKMKIDQKSIDFISTFLGDAMTLGGVDFSQQLWVEVEVKQLDNTYVVVDMRDMLSIVPYAMHSITSETAFNDTLGNLSCIEGDIAKYLSGDWQCADDDDTTYSAGNQLTLTGNIFDVTEGAGSGLDADLLDGQDGSYYTDWNNLTNMPGDIADGDDNTTYSAGTGIDLTDTTFNLEVPLVLSGLVAYGGIVNGANIDANGYGVFGLGSGTNGIGVYGLSQTGTGGYFTSLSGYGLIVENGNVGIGTTSPAEKLHVVGGHIMVTGGDVGPRGIVFDHGQPGTTVIFATDPALQLHSGASTRSIDFYGGSASPIVRITGNGNVGIGTTAPAEKLTVAGTIESTSGGVKFPDGTVQTTAAAPTYLRTIIVSPVPGDALASGTALLDAMAGITDATVTNPYLLKIEPGVYDLGNNGLYMKEYVDIEGSGENTTTITSTNSSGNPFDGTSATVIGANNAELRFLTVENRGGGDISLAIVNLGASPDISNVTATARGGDGNEGVFNASSSPTMTDVTATAYGGTHSIGVENMDSSLPTMTDVTAEGSMGSVMNLGVLNYGSTPIMTAVTATASGGRISYGVFNNNGSSPPIMTNVTATAYGGTENNTGVRNLRASAIIKDSSISGSDYSIYLEENSIAMVGATMLDGAVSGSGVFYAPSFVCVGAYDASFMALGTNCEIIP